MSDPYDNSCRASLPPLMKLRLKIQERKVLALTITFKPKFKLTVCKLVTKKFVLNQPTFKTDILYKGKMELYKLTPYYQWLYAHKYIKDKLKDFKYYFTTEYTQNGIVHFHGIIYHSITEGSIVNATIRHKLLRHIICIKNRVDNGWLTYMFKEDNRRLDFCTIDMTNNPSE